MSIQGLHFTEIICLSIGKYEKEEFDHCFVLVLPWVSCFLGLFCQCAAAFWLSCDLAGLFHSGGLPMTDVRHSGRHETIEKALAMVGGKKFEQIAPDLN